MNHPNKTPFIGVLTRLDEPSDKAPLGGRGHRVLLTKEAALDAIPTLIGISINFSTGKRHNPENKQGIIDSAWIQGQKLCVAGYIFGRDCPSVLKSISACVDAWGMSYELHDAHVDDLYAETWRLNRVTFTGAAVILKSEAAYKTTEFLLVEL